LPELTNALAAATIYRLEGTDVEMITTSPDIPGNMTAYGLAATFITVVANGFLSYLRDKRRERRFVQKIDENTRVNITALESANHTNEKIARSQMSATEVLEELRAVRKTGDETRGMVDRLGSTLWETRRDLTTVRQSSEETRTIVDRLCGRMVAEEIRLSPKQIPANGD